MLGFPWISKIEIFHIGETQNRVLFAIEIGENARQSKSPENSFTFPILFPNIGQMDLKK